MNPSQKIFHFVRSQSQADDDDDLFSDEVDLLDYGYLDSFGIVALIEFIDQEFGVDLSDRDFFDAQLRTISGIAETVAKAKRRGAG